MRNVQSSSGRLTTTPAAAESSRAEAGSSKADASPPARAIGHTDIEPRSAKASAQADGAYSPDNRMAPRVPINTHNPDSLKTYGYHFTLLKAYRSDEAPMKLYDGQFLRDLVKVENARNAELDLCVCSVGTNVSLKDWGVQDAMKKALHHPEKPHSCVLTDDNTHAAAMSMQVLGQPVPTTLSIVVVDSIKPKPEDLPGVKLHKSLLSEIERARGNDETLKDLRIQVTILPTGVQVSDEGCNIFALTAAKKAAASQGIKDLHAWAHDMVGHAAAGIHKLAVGLEPEMLLEPAFFKHAMKRNAIDEVLDARDSLGFPKDEPVNKKGDTLLGRFEKYERDTLVKKEGADLFTRYSRSYEEKRLEKLARLIEHKEGQQAGEPSSQPAAS